MGSSLNDLRKLNQDIERKKQQAEKTNKQAGTSERDLLSERMKAGIKERQSRTGQVASATKKVKKIILILFFGALAIIIAVILKTLFSDNSRPKKVAALMDNDFKHLDARHEDYSQVTGFVKKLLTMIKSGEDLDSLDWSKNITNSVKERSLKKFKILSSGTWVVNAIGYNEKFGFYSVKCIESGSEKIIILRLTEDENYKIKLAKVY
jgi:hypothetical protein